MRRLRRPRAARSRPRSRPPGSACGAEPRRAIRRSGRRRPADRRCARGSVQFEHEAGVVVEAAAERGREADARDVDAARGEEAGAAFEQIERWRQRSAMLASAASARSSAAASSGSPLIARKRSISPRTSRGSLALAPSAACSRKRSAISPTERPPTAVMPAIDSRSVTSACAPSGSEPASAASTP